MNVQTKKILLSGVKPTGRPHIGNYFGAIKQFVDLQDSGKYSPFIFIADYHALTVNQEPALLQQNILDIAIDYLAVGLDSKKTVLFKQSDVPEVTELAWIFNCLTSVSYLRRAHAYKAAVAEGREVSVGTFDYPLLMAADILIQDTDVVPVGLDQKQHVEITRDIAEKFNRVFISNNLSADSLPMFKLPEPLIIPTVAVVPGIDGRKMSKSYGNTIPLFASREDIQKLVMSIVTDSGAGIPKTVYTLHQLFKPAEKLKPFYEANRGRYKIIKEALIEDMDAFISPLRARRADIARDQSIVKDILTEGGRRARERARRKLIEVRKAIGVDFSR
jgi:tryptophanyl-tRNA synthetase